MKRISKAFVALLFCFSLLASTAMVSSAALSKVTGLTASSVSVDRVTLSWTAVSGAKKYQIRLYEGNSLKKTITTSNATASYTVTGLTPKKTYGFTVRAYSSAFNVGSYSSKLTVTTGVDNIKNLKATASATSVKLSWSKALGATGYTVQQKVSGKWKTLKNTTSNSYTVSNLKPDTKYAFRVRAYIKYNGKTYTGAYASITAKPCVAAPKLTVTLTYNSATVKWAKISGAAGYQVQLYKNKKWGSTAKLSKDATSYKYSKLTTGTSYKIRVRAYQKATVSGKSKTVYSAWTTVAVKPALTKVSTFKYSDLGTTSVKLTWSKVSGATGYKIYYYNASAKAWKTLATIKSGSTTSYVAKISSGTSYKLMIKAYNKTATSPASSEISFVSTPAKVAGLKATVTDTSIKLTWTKTACAKYTVAYKLGSGSYVTKTVTTNSFSLTGLDGAAKYTFKVCAVNSAGKSGSYSSELSATTGGVSTKTVPTLSYSSLGTTSVKLAWTSVPGAKGYVIYSYNASKKSWQSFKKISSTATSYTATIASGTNYQFRVKAYGTSYDGKTTVYGTASATKELTSLPAKVTGLKATVTNNSIKLTWTKTACAKYTVAYKLGSGSYVTKTVTTNSFSLTGLDGAAKYTFKVCAVNSAGKSGSYSSELSATTGGVSTKTVPTLSYSSLTASSVKLSWTAVAGAKGYIIENNVSGSWKQLKKISSTATSNTLTISANTEYQLRVKAYGTSYDGKTTVYGTASAATKFLSLPAQVAGLKTVSGDTSIAVEWNKLSCSGYEVSYKKSSESSYKTLKTTNTTVTLKGLSKNTTYNIRVRAYNKDSKFGSYSTVANATTYAGLTAVKNADSSIKLTWGAVNDAAKYVVQYLSMYNSWENLAETTAAEFTDNESVLKTYKGRLYRVVAYNKNDSAIYTSDSVVETIDGFNVSVNNNAVTLSWDPVTDAQSYIVYFYNIYGSSIATTASNATSKTTTSTSLTYYLAPGAIHRILIYADTGSSKKVVARLAVEMPELNEADTSNEGKNAQLLYLVQAINNTKFDDDYTVTVTSGGNLDYEISYLKLGFDTGSEAGNWALMRLLNSALDMDLGFFDTEVICNNAQEVQTLMNKLAEEGDDATTSGSEKIEEETYKFVNGTAKISSYATKSLNSFLEPVLSTAYWNLGQSPAQWTTAFSSVTATELEDGSHKIVAVLKKETTPNHHLGFLAKNTILGSSNDLGDMLGGSSSIVAEYVGATTITAVIDENNHLVSYEIDVPSKTKMAAEDDTEAEIEGNKTDVSMIFEAKIDSKAKYTYTFVEE